MAAINNATLTLNPIVGSSPPKVNIQVKYDAVFNASERNQQPHLRFLETIQIVGVDSIFGVESEEILIEKVLPTQEIPVTAGSGSLTVPRTRTVLALRSLLQEDPGPNADEIRCNIQIAYVVATATAASASANKVLAG